MEFQVSIVCSKKGSDAVRHGSGMGQEQLVVTCATHVSHLQVVYAQHPIITSYPGLPAEICTLIEYCAVQAACLAMFADDRLSEIV